MLDLEPRRGDTTFVSPPRGSELGAIFPGANAPKRARPRLNTGGPSDLISRTVDHEPWVHPQTMTLRVGPERLPDGKVVFGAVER